MEIGVSSTLAQHIFIFNFIFSLFSLLLMFAVHAKYKDTLYRVFAVIPLAMSLVFGNGFYVIVDRLFPHLASIDTEMTKYGLITLGNFTRVQSYIPLLLLLTTSMLVIILMYLIFGNTRKSLLALGILLSGFISRIILSFSPTIWVSGIRAHLVLIISMILCCIMVFQFLCQAKSHRFIQNLFIFIGMIAGFSYLNLIMSF
jgi:hypothetical protein